jgi:PII-like signaling protein
MPTIISVVDSAARIAEAAVAVEEMLEDGLIVVSDVEMTRLVRSRPVAEEANASKEPG